MHIYTLNRDRIVAQTGIPPDELDAELGGAHDDPVSPQRAARIVIEYGITFSEVLIRQPGRS